MKKFVCYLGIFVMCFALFSCAKTNGNDIHEHEFSDSWSTNELYHWHQATCGHPVTADKDEHTFVGNKCAVCSYTKSNGQVDPPPSDEHQHTFEEGWTNNLYYHWHEATCGHDVVSGKVSHSFVNNVCEVCGYKLTPDHPAGDGQPVQITFNAGIGMLTDGRSSVTYIADDEGKVMLDQALTPKVDAYAFMGWYNGNTEYDESVSYATSTTFTAKFDSGATTAVYQALFDEDSTVTIDIDMSDAEWKKLSHDYTVNDKSPIYRVADSVTIGIDSGDGMLYYYYEEVGVRLKGNTSRHEFYGNDGFTNAAHFKLSFKQTFDDIADGYTQDELKVWEDSKARKARKNRTFGGMEKIDVKYNSTLDETYVREMYAMKLFRENGILAPNVTLCALTALECDSTVKNMGIYRVHEPIDEVFLERNLGADEATGDLYKCTWGNGTGASLSNADDWLIGVEDELNRLLYTYDKKTNKKVTDVYGNLDFSSIKDFINAIKSYGADYENLIDTDYFAQFEAVNYILGNPDCIRNNYNNYYIYFRPSDGKAILIPYDYDRCLGLTYECNPTGSANMYVTPYTRTIAMTGAQQQNPLYINLIDKGAPYGEGSVLMRYRSDLLALADSVLLSAGSFDAYENNYRTRYAEYVNSAIGANRLAFDSNAPGNVPYSQYMPTKLETLRSNIDNYRA